MDAMMIGVGALGLLFVGLFALLSRLEAGRRRRMIADVSRSDASTATRSLTRSPSSTSTRSFQFSGELLPREEASLGPVDYRRIPAAEPAGYYQTTQTAKHAPTLETSVIIPALTATGTAISVTIATGALAWAFGWPGKTVLIVFALSLVGAWFWRLGFADKVLWAVESWTGKDFDHDHNIGRPAVGFAVVNPGRARAAVAQQAAQNATETRTAALLAFVDRCYLSGTSEGAHGITASGPDRDNYTTCRDTIMNLGLAQWKNPNRPRGGWVMTTDPVTCKGIVGQHAL